jgi:heme-degrading monooxygenase HmoA
MKNFIASLILIAAMPFTALVSAQTTPATAKTPVDAVTVVVQLTLLPGAKPEATAAAMNDMRAMIKKQPGFISEELLQNANPANAPQNVHVMRWASFKNWESVFNSPEFAKLNAANAKQYTVLASAFKTVK